MMPSPDRGVCAGFIGSANQPRPCAIDRIVPHQMQISMRSHTVLDARSAAEHSTPSRPRHGTVKPDHELPHVLQKR